MSGCLRHAPATGSNPRPARRRVRPRLAAVGRLSMLLVALAGLFAMHGLSDHGVGGAVAAPGFVAGQPADHLGAQAHRHAAQAAEADPMTSAHAAPAPAGSGSALGPASSDTPAARSSAGTSDGDGHGDGHGSHGPLVGVCLAVMAAVLLLGFAARQIRSVRELTITLTDLAGRIAAGVCARARGPARPDLRLLSIQRC
jgi:hypothetical protein